VPWHNEDIRDMNNLRYFLSAVFVLTAALPYECASSSGFYFSNYSPAAGVDAPVFDGEGTPLAGTNYLAILYGGNTTDALALPLDSSTRKSMPAVPFAFAPNGKAGYFRHFTVFSAIVYFGNISAGQLAWLQVRAWDARLGATYEDVASLGIGGYGESNLFQDSGGDPFAPVPGLPGILVGLESFSLRPITGVLIRTILHTDDQLALEWYGGLKRYQLQQTTALDQPWQDLGEPTTAFSYTNTITGTARFYRVVGLPN
jgi:hypothetical protein